jgi:Fic family protein
VPQLGRSDVKTFVEEANRKYFHWDKLRFLPAPVGFSPPEAWSLVKFSRASNRASLPLLDIGGRAFSYILPMHAQEILHEVDRGGGASFMTDESTKGLQGEREQVLVSSLMEEAIATSQIEGAVTTRQVAKDLLRSERKPRDKSEQMIVNSYRTIRFLRTRLEQPLTVAFLIELQEMMTADTLDDPSGAGRLRTAKDDVHVVDSRDGEVVFTPPPADALKDRLARLVEFANAEHSGAVFVHPLVKASILHFWLAYEHPFVDGNGRTARSLFYWQMLRSGYWLFEYLTISRVILASPSRYYRSFLHSEQDDNDLTYSILYQVEATKTALAELHEYLGQKRKEKRVFATVYGIPRLNSRQREAIVRFMKNPDEHLTVSRYCAIFGVSYVTARKDLTGLEAEGWAVSRRNGRAIAFIAPRDLERRVHAAGKKRG